MMIFQRMSYSLMGDFKNKLKKILTMGKKVYRVDLNEVIKDFNGVTIINDGRLYIRTDNDTAMEDLNIKAVLETSFLMQGNEKVGDIEKVECARIAERLHNAKDTFDFTAREFETGRKLMEKTASGLIVLQVTKYLDSIALTEVE